MGNEEHGELGRTSRTAHALRLRSAQLARVLPAGTLAVGSGVIVQGITAYGFLVVSARALGPERFAGVSVLWALTFLIALGCFLPLEQELARGLATRAATGAGGGQIIRRVGLVGASVLAVVLLATLLGSRILLERLFERQLLLIASLGLSLTTYFVVHLARGILAGTEALASYGVLLATDGCVRLFACLALATAGSTSAGAYGLAFALSPLVAVVMTVRRKLIPTEAGLDASLAGLPAAVGQLVLGSLLSQVLVNGPVLALKMVASDADQAAAGRLLAGLVAARVQLFLFSAVLVALLPKLSAFASQGQVALFRSELRRMMLLVAAIGGSFTLGALLLGEPGMRLVFGSEFSISRRDLTFLTGANGILLIALTSAQALVALAAHRRVVIGWFCGVVAFFAALTASGSPNLRVEIAFLAGSVLAAAILTGLLLEETRRPIGYNSGGTLPPALEVPPS